MMSLEEIEREVAAMEGLDALLAGIKDEFVAFQACVRETYGTRGSVLVPENSLPKALTTSVCLWSNKLFV